MPNTSAVRRDLRNEAPIVAQTRTLKDLAKLRRDLIDNGCSPAEAAGICAWVLAKVSGEADTTSLGARTRYRKRLSELAGDPYNEPGNGRPRDLGGDSETPIIIVPPEWDALVRGVLDEPPTALHSVT